MFFPVMLNFGTRKSWLKKKPTPNHKKLRMVARVHLENLSVEEHTYV